MVVADRSGSDRGGAATDMSARGMSSHTGPTHASEAPVWVYTALLALIALTGGASRADSLAQPVVRVGAIVLVAAMALLWRPVEWRSLRLPLLFLAVLALAMMAMLVPLPPSVWTALPGRALFAEAAPLAGFAQPWRPVALVPQLGLNALFALVPPAAALIGLAYLTPGQRARLISPIVVLIMASAFLGLAQVSAGMGSGLRYYAITNREAGVGFFANRNHQALLLALGLPALAIWATSGAVRMPAPDTRRWIGAGAAIFLALAIPTTGSRAGLVLGAVGLIGAGILIAAAVRRGLRRLPRRWRGASIIAGIVLIVLLLVVSLTFRQATAVQRLFALDVGADTRTLALPTLKAMAQGYFPVGTGFGAFEPAFRAAEPTALLRPAYLNEAHNDILQVAIEAGAVGLILLVAFILWWLYRSVAIWRMSAAVAHVRLARAGSVMVAMTLLASAADYPARTPLIMTIVAIACAWMQLPRNRTIA